MNNSRRIKEILFWIIATLSVLAIIANLGFGTDSGDTSKVAREFQKSVQKRMDLLADYSERALQQASTEWISLRDLPGDMVIYRYVNDTLQSWVHTFPIRNDKIAGRYVLQSLANPRAEVVSRLKLVEEVPSFLEIGSKWYIVRSFISEGVTLIAGLEIADSRDEESQNGVNPKLKLADKYSVSPLETTGGSAVEVDGVPQFKVQNNSLHGYKVDGFYSGIIAFILVIVALILFLSLHKSLKVYLVTLGVILVPVSAMYTLGGRMQDYSKLFSPSLYADGQFLYSLGAVLLLNILIVLLVGTTFMMRRELLEFAYAKNGKRRVGIFTMVFFLLSVAILVGTGLTVKSIAVNSRITLELYKMERLTIYSGVVYASFISVLLMIPLLLQMMRPGFKMWLGVDFHPFSRVGRLSFSLFAAAFIVAITSVVGFQKEQNRVKVWANRLSVDRDISLELNLRSVEKAIASDVILASLSVLDNSAGLIQNRLAESYLFRIAQDYDISVVLLTNANRTPALMDYFAASSRLGEPIAANSYFKFQETGTGHARYTGMFSYYTGPLGLSRMLVNVEPKAAREDRGYSKLIGRTAPGKVVLPSRYSYARYGTSDLMAYKGSYAYPTKVNDAIRQKVSASSHGQLKENGYRHFFNNVSDGELIIISRPAVETYKYILAIVFLALVCYFLVTVMVMRRTGHIALERNYYRAKVTTVLISSLVVTLVAMSLVSVIFVYRRNDANKKSLMSDRTSSIQSMVQSRCRTAVNWTYLNNPEFSIALEEMSKNTRADITLFTPQGEVFRTTMPEVFDGNYMGCRINSVAYEDIVFHDKRFCLVKERMGRKKYFAMYAPVFNDAGQMIAIMSSPYTENNYDFESEAVLHLVMIITVFLILLIIAKFLIAKIVERMFKPLVEMDRKMNATSVDSLEHIEYEGEDEITTLVSSYNRMVTDLSDSTRKLAQAERDKAWSAMARQVAHEIKNPLTPMKLQLQRIIRLKQRNDPTWQDKFDEATTIVLEHIDVLTQTANDFSTFAKLYSEEPSELDLDLMLKKEMSMFDNRDDIEFSYIGLEGAFAMGPKPQLTRVFVNLITNAGQAVEMARQDDLDAGRDARPGKVVVSLRNSSSDDSCYDIVFEDNGSGVSEENKSKLFTPNFTTKSSGTGLGLAISKNILEKCGASIYYTRSFSLGGACFTIVYPKKGK